MFFIRGHVHICMSSRFYYSFHPLFQHDFARKKRRNRLTDVVRFALLSSLNWQKAYLSITDAIHPLILMTEQSLYRLHIQDRHHLRALVKDCNILKHLEDTPYRQTLRKFDQNASLFLCWLAPLIRYCLTCLLQRLTQLAFRNTVNHEPHYHHHRNYPAFVFQEHTMGKEHGVF